MALEVLHGDCSLNHTIWRRDDPATNAKGIGMSKGIRSRLYSQSLGEKILRELDAKERNQSIWQIAALVKVIVDAYIPEGKGRLVSFKVCTLSSCLQVVLVSAWLYP